MLSRSGGNHQLNMDMLKSMYEQTHKNYLAIFTAVLVLAGGIIGSFIAVLVQDTGMSDVVTWIVVIAVAILVVSLFILSSSLDKLQRNYLDIIQIYNLLARYF
jgi:uncharacterized membrane protein YfcA